MPTSVISTRGSVRHIRPLPSDSTTQTDAGVGDREVRAAEADLHAQELLAQELPRRGGEVLRLGRRAPPAPCVRWNMLADLGAVAMQRRHDDVRRPVVAELDDQIGEIGLVRRDAGGLERRRSAASRRRSSS